MMKMVRPILLAIAALMLSFAPFTVANAQETMAPDWQVYKNHRYNFTLSYPAGLFHTREISTSGDGVTLKSKDGKAQLLMYGMMNGDELSPQKVMDILLENSDDRNVVYKRAKDNWIVISAYEKEDGPVRDIYYQKLVASPDLSQFSVFEIWYPEDQRAVFDPLLKRMGTSLSSPK